MKGLGSAAYASTTDFDQFGAAASVVGTQLDPAGTVTVYGALAAAEAAPAVAAGASLGDRNARRKTGSERRSETNPPTAIAPAPT